MNRFNSFISAYGATLSTKDVEILQELFALDAFASLHKFNPFIWGEYYSTIPDIRFTLEFLVDLPLDPSVDYEDRPDLYDPYPVPLLLNSLLIEIIEIVDTPKDSLFYAIKDFVTDKPKLDSYQITLLFKNLLTTKGLEWKKCQKLVPMIFAVTSYQSTPAIGLHSLAKSAKMFLIEYGLTVWLTNIVASLDSKDPSEQDELKDLVKILQKSCRNTDLPKNCYKQQLKMLKVWVKFSESSSMNIDRSVIRGDKVMNFFRGNCQLLAVQPSIQSGEYMQEFARRFFVSTLQNFDFNQNYFFVANGKRWLVASLAAERQSL
uniref:Uncharacterized protein n=1 Tax=Tetranychus urticae TaxID=32264 RepID=T1K7L8_TETUR